MSPLFNKIPINSHPPFSCQSRTCDKILEWGERGGKNHCEELWRLEGGEWCNIFRRSFRLGSSPPMIEIHPHSIKGRRVLVVQTVHESRGLQMQDGMRSMCGRAENDEVIVGFIDGYQHNLISVVVDNIDGC